MIKARSWKHKVTTLCTLVVLAMPVHGAVRKDPPASIRGAIYVPYSAYNAPQMWKNFDAEETRRDLGYAKKIHLNACACGRVTSTGRWSRQSSRPVGSFFWCLMAKRAYLKGQRKFGTLNGLFWPDGAVVNVKDARAVAQDPKLKFKERPLPGNLK